MAVCAALALLVISIERGTYAASDSDPYGYISQADLMTHGTLRVAQPFVREMPWPFPEWTFSPPAYRPVADGFIVPSYPPGLPFLMAVFQYVKGRDAVFYVVPVLGVLAVLMSAVLGARLHSPLAGALTAVLVASSPSVLYQVLQPVSDIPAMAWWTTSLAMALQGGTAGALLAGSAASMAIVTRPNLVPLAGVIGAFLLRSAVWGPRDERRAAVRRLVVFALACAPGCLAVAAFNRYLYGSALLSGYGDLGPLYSLANLVPNLDRYPRWLCETQSPLVCLAVLAPWLLRKRPAAVWLSTAFMAAVFASYLFYVPWGRDDWGYLRFLLPAYPPLLALTVAVLLEGARRIIRRPWAAVMTPIAICAALVAWQARTASARGVFFVNLSEQRYVDVGHFVAATMPADAVFITGAEAGSLRYYANRLTLRFALLPEGWLDIAVETLRTKGYHPYVLLEEDEEAPFRERFKGRNELAALDWPPMAERYNPIRVRIYDPDDRPRFLAGQAIVTGNMNLVQRPALTVKQD